MANKKITDLMSGTPVRDSLLESAIDISGTMDSRKVKAGVIADLANANVAAPYDSTVTYAIGQYCLYEGDIYRCIAITTGAFDSTAWVQIVVTGEFRRVVELTSAQYTALSSAEKNNGTLYILTDEETTAADIPYSQGVSVADKLDSLSDTSVETRPSLITLPTGSSLNAYIQTYGRLVVINLVGFLGPAYTSIGELHFTNLPQLYEINELYAITPKGRFRIYNDGDVASIRLYDTNNATSYIGVPFVYLTV